MLVEGVVEGEVFLLLSCFHLQEASQLAQKIKEEGNKSFKNGDFYDALWKYKHSFVLLKDFPDLEEKIPIVFSNISASCLKLGDEGRNDLVHCNHLTQPDPLSKEGMWYIFSGTFATTALTMSPPAHIKRKVGIRDLLWLPLNGGAYACRMLL